MELRISSSQSDVYQVSGSVIPLLQNRRSSFLLRSHFVCEVRDDLLEISTTEPIERVANILKLAASYIHAEVKYEDGISEVLQNFKEEENKFDIFGKQALDIKADRCIKSDFEEFTSSLETHMTNRRLYPMQLLSAYHLAFSQNACNFSVPGAGKTSIVYGAYTYLKNLPASHTKKVDAIMIVCPLSAFGPWESEYEECYGRKPTSKRISGSLSAEYKNQYFYGDTDELIMISYQSVYTVLDSILYYLQHHKVMVVLDEAHKIKNTKGGRTAESLLKIAPHCSARVILTGTPAPNGYEDLYNLFNFIWPKRNVTKYTVGQLKDMTKQTQDNRVPHLLKNIDPFYIRIKKSDLGITPPVDYPPISVPMYDSQRKVYDFIERKFIEATEDKTEGLHSLLTKARLIRLQQAATNPALLRQPIQAITESGEDFSSIAQVDRDIIDEVLKFCRNEIPAKFIACANKIKEIIQSGGKVVVWAIFIKTIELLEKYLKEEGIESRSLYGATPVATDGMTEEDEGYELTREAIIKQFHKTDCPFKVIIANPFAVAESISLHKACHNAIYLERSFNCAHFIQSKDRIHRYGLAPGTKTSYYYILSTDSVDEVVDERLHEKEARMIHIIESSPIPLFDNLGDDGDEDIKAIIAAYVRRKNREIQ